MSASKNSNRLAVIAASLLLNLPLSTFGQSTTDDGPQPDLEALFEAREFEGKDGHSLLYRLFTPRPYDPSRQYPVLVFLHGNGGRGDDNLGQLQRGNAGVLSAFLSADARARYACFIVAPQVPREPEASSDWGGLERPPST